MKCIECKKEFKVWEDEYGEIHNEFCQPCQSDRDAEEYCANQGGTINESIVDIQHKNQKFK